MKVDPNNTWRKVEERLTLLRAASFEGILIHDEGRVVDCNDRLLEMIGYTRAEVFEPGHMARVVAPEDFPEVLERIRKKIEGEFLVTCVRKDGSRLIAEFCTKQTHLGERPIRVVAVRDVTSAWAVLNICGPRSREVLQALSDDDLSNDAFPFLAVRDIEVGPVPVRAVRVGYVGELGYELHVPTEYAPALYEALKTAGAAHGIRDVGYRMKAAS